MNIEEILAIHQPLLSELEKCVQEHNCDDIGEIFLKKVNIF